ncbi:hypothetical protein DOY81_003157 [Sarcophaga bullata]|nr:hypothetical protein DOY81_003157 [Sarcophaga bullata]
MAASSSANFFVHQNQNKAANLNSSSAASAFAVDDCDVVEFIEFPLSTIICLNNSSNSKGD